MANFNFTASPEYTLNTALTEELINLYGILVKFLVTEKINVDSTVFGDYSHLKSDNSNIYDIYMLPENSEDWDSTGYNISQFGLINLENVVLFAARSNFSGRPLSEIVGNLIIFPNNKIMEISDVDPTVVGINNLFTYNDTKSVYKLTCRPYNAKLINELDNVDISTDSTPYETLDNYFQELTDTALEQDTEAQTTPQVTTVETNDSIDKLVERAIVDKTEDDVWGQFS